MERDDVMRETIKHVRRVGTLMIQVSQELQWRAIEHDDSKFSEQEFDAFARETPGLRTMTYGSPEYGAALERLGPALSEHYKRNDHHPEHFTGGVHDMDLVQLIEMLADWKAATERHADGSLARSIVQNAKRFHYDAAFAWMLARTAKRLDWISDHEFAEHFPYCGAFPASA